MSPLPTLSDRASGLLLHPTSLPGGYGNGDLGVAAHRFATFLAAAGQRWWQMLPVHPVGDGYSPYHGQSAFAGASHLIALEPLVRAGWLRPEEAAPPRRRLPSGGVPRTSGGSLDQTVQVQFTQIHDAVNEALEQANAVYAQLSTQNLNPRTNLYTISSPFRVTTVRALTTRTLAFYGVLVVALALVAVPLGCVVHHYVRTDLLAEVPPSHARAPSPEQSHDHGSGVR